MRRPSFILLALLTIAGCDGSGPTACLAVGCGEPPVATSGNLEGTVRDDLGNPLVGALVATSPATLSALTDAAGSFSIRGLEAGSYTVVAAKEGYLASSATTPVIAAGTSTVDLVLPAEPLPNAPNGQAVLFVLVLGPDGAPRSEVEVEFRKLNQIDTARATTDPEGLAIFGPASIGTYEVVASAEIGGHLFRARTVMQGRIREGTTATLQLRRVF